MPVNIKELKLLAEGDTSDEADAFLVAVESGKQSEIKTTAVKLVDRFVDDGTIEPSERNDYLNFTSAPAPETPVDEPADDDDDSDENGFAPTPEPGEDDEGD